MQKRKRGQRGPGACWEPLHCVAETMAEAKSMVRSEGHWKVARRGQGDGRRSIVYDCIEHIKCKVQCRVTLAKDNLFHLFQKGKHTKAVNKKKRKNSAMDEEQEKELLCDIWKGVKPAGSRLAMTLQKERRSPSSWKQEKTLLITSGQTNRVAVC